ncbi:PREDICTED: uncharacterized protein LOC104811015 [Tarenaya hassleriana]|uniref:uncharacterized protein LOC104811015 n=1 Tax=Tarenaya hassleriana TaxID=28532 RepID=UPI00053CA8E1|nr:PREDICTED: uncharacterized protein LOC104811015 [Tarenaya hassleriana]XP_010535847.1 PREDICTED: uncharacterized protein LOC104811015 [Tarenaya hassleriana]
MGKQKGKQKLQNEGTSEDNGDNDNNMVETVDCVVRARGLKEEGNKLFQKRDYKGAMSRYEEAIKVLPRDHEEVPDIRAYMATCYMQMGPNEYPKAIHECDLALKVNANHSKALLKRARCYEALNKLDLALRDVCMVLEMDPNNPMASEISEKLRRTLESKGLRVKDAVIELPPDYVEPAEASTALWVVEDKTQDKKKKGSNQVLDSEKGKEKATNKQNKKKGKEKRADKVDETREEQDKEIIAEEVLHKSVEEVKKTVKLIYADDVRWAKVPLNCTLFQLREIIHDRFSSLRAVHIKYRDPEGDLVTITTNEELRMAEASENTQDTMKFYVVEVSPEQDQFFGRLIESKKLKTTIDTRISKVKRQGTCKIEDWMTEFARLFKDQVTVDSRACLNLQELGMKIYSEAMEEAVTSEEAQGLFDRAADQFQEMAARSLLKLGHVFMSRARKRLSFSQNVSMESIPKQTETAYEWVQKEYTEARKKYEEAMRIKPDLYETFLALGLQQFEEAKLSWYYVLFSHIDLKTWPCEVVLQLYQKAENNIAKSIQLWKKLHGEIPDGPHLDTRADAAEKFKSRLNILWAAILYERSLMEYKLDLPVWKECLDAAMKKFEVAGTCAMDEENYAKNNTLRDMRFQMEDVTQICNEIDGAKTWRTEIPSDQLRKIFKRRISDIFHVSETEIHCG